MRKDKTHLFSKMAKFQLVERIDLMQCLKISFDVFLNKTFFFQIWSHVWSSARVLLVAISFPGQKLSPWPTNSYYSSQTTFFFRRVWPKIWISSLDIRKEKLFLLAEQNIAEVYRSEFFSIWNSISLYLTKNKVLG